MNKVSKKGRSDYARFQVKICIKNHPGIYLRQLVRTLGREHKGIWSLGKVQKIVNDLEERKVIRSEVGWEGGQLCRRLYIV